MAIPGPFDIALHGDVGVLAGLGIDRRKVATAEHNRARSKFLGDRLRCGR